MQGTIGLLLRTESVEL